MRDLTLEEKKALPGYSDGYFDAFERVRKADKRPGYFHGWTAGDSAAAIMRNAGFEQRGTGFTRTFKL